MKKDIVKLIIKELAQAPQIAAQKVLDSLTNEEDKKTAIAIFKAVDIKIKTE